MAIHRKNKITSLDDNESESDVHDQQPTEVTDSGK